MTLRHRELGNRTGLVETGRGLWTWRPPDGSWGWSNAGLVTDGDEALLVDTLFDGRLTRAMLAAMRDASPAAAHIGTVVNTHSNGDHCYGNGLVEGAAIIATRAAAEEMERESPALIGEFLRRAPELGSLGAYVQHCFGAFDFDDTAPRLPTRTFDGALSLRVGDRAIELLQVGPAHTGGDLLVHLPGDDVVFTGDILFIEGTPIAWAGPIQHWIDACEEILALGASVVVPGHGPITDARGVVGVRDYLAYVQREARQRYDAGLSVRDAAFDIALGDYDAWGDAERIAVNVATLYREFAGDPAPPNVIDLFGLMADLWHARRR